MLTAHWRYTPCLTCDVTFWRQDVEHEIFYLSREIWASSMDGIHRSCQGPSLPTLCPHDSGVVSACTCVGRVYLASPQTVWVLQPKYATHSTTVLYFSEIHVSYHKAIPHSTMSASFFFSATGFGESGLSLLHLFSIPQYIGIFDVVYFIILYSFLSYFILLHRLP